MSTFFISSSAPSSVIGNRGRRRRTARLTEHSHDRLQLTLVGAMGTGPSSLFFDVHVGESSKRSQFP